MMIWRKALSIMVCMAFLLPASLVSTADDNLIQNGTFDIDMSNWSIATSRNFSVTVNNGVCDFNTTHTDHLEDYGQSFHNGTTYNMTVAHGDPSGNDLGYHIEIGNVTYELLNETFDTLDLNGWEYDEHSELEPFLRSNFSSAYKLSDGYSLGAEAKKLSNITDFDYDFSTEPESFTYENGSADFVYAHNQLECLYTGNRESARVWNISQRYIVGENESNQFGMEFTLNVNESGYNEIGSWIRIGYGNRSDPSLVANNDFSLILGRYNSTHYRSRVTARNNTGSALSSPYRYLNVTNLTDGIRVTIWVGYYSVIYCEIFDQNTDFRLASISLAGLADIRVNSIMVRNYYIGTSRVTANLTSLKSWLSSENLPTSGTSSLERQLTLTNSSVRLEIETNRLHYHDAQNGLIRSSVSMITTSGKTEFSNVSTTSTGNWIATHDALTDVSGTPEFYAWNYFSLTEGATSFPAKGVYYDNLKVTAIEYDSNGSFTSAVLDRGYYADWRDLEIYFNQISGSYSVPPGWDTIFAVDVYTRVGNHQTIDGTWSSWQPLIGKTFTDEGDILTWAGAIASKNGRFIQYKVEVTNWKRGLESPILLLTDLSSVPVDISTEWGSIEQSFYKPYTNYSILKYDYSIVDLNNSLNGTINISINGNLVNQHNFTFFETTWDTVEIALPDSYNASGVYTLNITVFANFNSTNGSATVWFDNVEFLIAEQAPVITSFEAHNATEVWFTGTFRDYTRGADYDFLGLDGIDTVNITVGGTVLEVDNYEYLGNGTFYFNYTWENTPFQISGNVTENATLTVRDTTGRSDTATIEIIYPSATGFMMSFLYAGIFIIIILLIFQRHLMTDWDTDKGRNEQSLLPDTIVGDKGR